MGMANACQTTLSHKVQVFGTSFDFTEDICTCSLGLEFCIVKCHLQEVRWKRIYCTSLIFKIRRADSQDPSGWWQLLEMIACISSLLSPAGCEQSLSHAGFESHQKKSKMLIFSSLFQTFCDCEEAHFDRMLYVLQASPPFL